MAIIEVKVPQLSESVAEATLLTWHKKVGEAVTRDENLIDVEKINKSIDNRTFWRIYSLAIWARLFKVNF